MPPTMIAVNVRMPCQVAHRIHPREAVPTTHKSDHVSNPVDAHDVRNVEGQFRKPAPTIHDKYGLQLRKSIS